jgi:hypothetical protein
MQQEYDRLTSTNPDKLTEVVGQLDSFSEQHIEAKEKTDNYQFGRSLKKIKLYGTILFAVLCGIALCSFAWAVFTLFYLYVVDIQKSPESIRTVLSEWFNYGLISLTTLFIHSKISKK